jgi:hypothetical protein
MALQEVNRHWLPWHTAPLPQAVVQLPQWAASELLSASQPVVALPSQSRNEPMQVSAHCPPTHPTPAWAGAPHAFMHAPQLLRSVWVFAQNCAAPLPHEVGNPLGQAQVPPTQL